MSAIPRVIQQGDRVDYNPFARINSSFIPCNRAELLPFTVTEIDWRNHCIKNAAGVWREAQRYKRVGR